MLSSRTLFVSLAASVAVGLACTAGCSSSDPTSIGASDEAITTTEVLSRAEQWVNAKLLYCQSANHARDYDTACSTYCNRQDNPLWDPYRSDCSGFVSWSWGLPSPGRVTSQFAPFNTQVSHAIQATDLQPGDAVNNSEHIMLFVKWVTKNTEAEFYEEPGCSSSTPYAHGFTSSVSISGSSIHVSWNGMTFTSIRYDSIQPPNVAPKGYLDTASCDTIAGWSQDTDTPAAPVNIQITFDAPTGQPGSGTLKRTANAYRADLCKSLGSCDHAFSTPMPLGLLDGTKHTAYAYGADTDNNALALLTQSPKTFTCSPPAIPSGVKRHVPDPAALAAWKFDPLLDIAKEPLAAVIAVPDGPELPATPTVVLGDDGAPEVWVIDGTVRRHVISPTSMQAWGFAATQWPAAKISALAQGADWPAAPFVMQGVGGPAVYVMDGTPDAASPGGGGNGSGGSSGGQGASGGPGGGSGGCSASGAAHGSSADAAALLGVALVLASRRRRRPAR
ncbi:MAG TPA: hypothetical protein VLM85_05590 [Polyangiaceae bacterium]|nr:hypothetical protein [Polyangiaceae bacterium]